MKIIFFEIPADTRDYIAPPLLKWGTQVSAMTITPPLIN
jgi:hypothetical protein